ncbi:MAG: C1 family peptidase [Propionibacteriaceae bacterium]|jgi:bleomycin hydrolase|nr:C1 family peptidase [Propionibacteriaceae bacterium]
MTDGSLQLNDINTFAADFAEDPVARLAANAVANNSIDQVALDRNIVTTIDPSMSNQLDTWSVNNQKHSGRCWLFATCNLLKSYLIPELGAAPDFELSQSFLHFYDKLEKANWFANAIIETADRDLDDRTIARLLADPIGDGGQWDMVAALIKKYGIAPKYAMPETESSSNTGCMNRTLSTLLRRGARDLRKAAAEGKAEEARLELMKQVYRVLVIHLGTPPTEFCVQYRDKDKQFHRLGTFSPLEFANKYIRIDVDEQVCVVNDPRHEYGRVLTVEYLGNVVGGQPIRYLNAEPAVLKELVKTRIVDGHAVWFGCDVSKQFERKAGLWDAKLFDYEGAYGIDLGMTKAEQMEYGESSLTHAMLFTGVDITDAGEIRRFRVENSWGDDRSDTGFDTMNESWFDEHVFEVVVPASSLTDELRAALTTDPIKLPLWDPMGSLA